MNQNRETYESLEEYYIVNIEPRLQDMGFDVHPIFPTADWLFSQIKWLDEHKDFSLRQNATEIQQRLAGNNKGVVVAQCLLRFKDRFRDKGIDIVLHIDGSKAFDMNSIIDVTRDFVEPSIDAVLTVRKNNTGMTRPRELLEDFERFIVCNSFPDSKIMDGQSGCWALKYKTDIFLTAKSYEIELDILTELLRLEMHILWQDVKLNPRKPSQFNYLPNSIEKVKFLCSKLRVSKEKLILLVNEFYRLHSEQIKEIDNEEATKNNPCLFVNYMSEIEKIGLP